MLLTVDVLEVDVLVVDVLELDVLGARRTIQMKMKKPTSENYADM
jgi:hypothetical protein